MKFPSEQEQGFILQYIVLPLLLTVLERDKKIILNTPLKIKAPYLSLFDFTIKTVEQSVHHNRKTLRLHGIKVYSQKRTEKGIEVRYLYHGYQHLFQPSWDTLRMRVSEMMERIWSNLP
ncbi:hypothetical protein [Ammoniphilus sp. YIM 78166]|uniref:hypothetical protein n=1 Tax=Ammoniphilus sp. YIM 78166 TaxID=1644106 RepID=UPI001070072C|nr:hypothetical protein [Ammoniphilus sp. YIM 78166]